MKLTGLFFLAVSLAAPLSAATITAREISSTTTHPLKGKAPSTADDFVFLNELRTEVILSPQEMAAGATVEVYYCRPTISDRQLAGEATAPAKEARSVATHKITYEGGKKWPTYWAARVLIGGKVVATAGETDKALEWVKARKVTEATK